MFTIHAILCTAQAVDVDGNPTKLSMRTSLPVGQREWLQCFHCESLENLSPKQSPLTNEKIYKAVSSFGQVKALLDSKVLEAAAGVFTPFSPEETALLHSTKSYNRPTLAEAGLVVPVCLGVVDRCKGHTHFRKVFEENRALQAKYGELTGDKLLSKFFDCYKEKLFNQPFLQLARCMVERLTGNTRAPLGPEWQAVVVGVSAHSPPARKLLSTFLVAHSERHEFRIHAKWDCIEKIPIPPQPRGDEKADTVIYAACLITLNHIAECHKLSAENPGVCGVLSDSTTLIQGAMKHPDEAMKL
mmetsp:Transcript_2123/g.4480  ORF Transcript_2123/g.4480 Transcript_2123/m.4480 type:complete len:301 (+) Transcript_2123:636-1538(+)